MCALGASRRRLAAILLAHVNVLLMLFSGAALATAARLKWDPSAYVPLREALPLEYRAACALLLLLALLLLALAHLALAALFARASSRLRRPALCTYAAVMCALTLVEVSAGAWAAWRVAAWLRSPAAARLLELAEMRDHLRAALDILARWYPLPERLNDLIDEAIADAPRNGYCAEGACAALLALQLAAAALALLAAAPPAPLRLAHTSLSSLSASDAPDQRARGNYHSEASNSAEKAPLRTAYKHGRLVIL